MVVQVNSSLAVSSTSSGPRCCVRRWMMRDTSGPPRMAARISSSTCGATASPMSRLFISIASTTAITPRSRPIPMLPSASHRALPVISARLMPTSANMSPTSAPVSSSSTTGSSGLLVVRMNVHHDLRPRRRGLVARGAQRPPLQHDRDAEHAERPDRRVELVGVDELLDALVQSEHRAEGEEHERDDERPEVALGAEPERVLGGRFLLRALAAEEQQPLVAGVGDRVDRLRQHRRRPGDHERGELRDRDAEVGEERGDDGALRCPQPTSRTAHTALVGMRTISPSMPQHRRIDEPRS